MRFQERKGLLQGQAGKAASDRYLEVGREIRDYEKQLHKEWCVHAEDRLPHLLREHVLAFDQEASLASVAQAEQQAKTNTLASAKMVAGTATRESVTVRCVLCFVFFSSRFFLFSFLSFLFASLLFFS